jgi:WD40 repeat protein
MLEMGPRAQSTRSVLVVASSQDGRYTASGKSDGFVDLWLADDPFSAVHVYPPLHFVLGGHSSPILAVTFSPSGKELALASGSNILQIWEIYMINGLDHCFDISYMETRCGALHSHMMGCVWYRARGMVHFASSESKLAN